MQTKRLIRKERPHRDAYKKALKLKENYISHLIAIGRIDMSKLKYHGVILTFFGCGKWKYGPGTFASFVTTCIWFLVTYVFFLKGVSVEFETTMWLVMSAAMFLYGIFITPLYSRITGVEDHPSIVLDEVMGQLVALALTYPLVKPFYFVISDFKINFLIVVSHISFCFISFRLLDIAKPSIIGTIDRTVKGGVGVMLDDLVCGIISGVCGIAIFKALEYYLSVSALS